MSGFPVREDDRFSSYCVNYCTYCSLLCIWFPEVADEDDSGFFKQMRWLHLLYDRVCHFLKAHHLVAYCTYRTVSTVCVLNRILVPDRQKVDSHKLASPRIEALQIWIDSLKKCTQAKHSNPWITVQLPARCCNWCLLSAVVMLLCCVKSWYHTWLRCALCFVLLCRIRIRHHVSYNRVSRFLEYTILHVWVV